MVHPSSTKLAAFYHHKLATPEPSPEIPETREEAATRISITREEGTGRSNPDKEEVEGMTMFPFTKVLPTP